MTKEQFAALFKQPFEIHQHLVSTVDIHGNVLKRSESDFT